MDTGRSHQQADTATSSNGTPPSQDRTLYLIRHGRTRLNAEGLLRGHLDVELDDTGRREAQALAETFKGLRLGRVVTSPLQRALATAERIAEATGAPLEVNEALIDRDYGPWAGKPRSELDRRCGSLDRAPGVEPAASLMSRALVAIDQVARTAGAERVAVVAHDAVNRALLVRLPVNTPTEPDDIAQHTGCWNRLDHRDGTWLATVIDALPGDGTTP